MSIYGDFFRGKRRRWIPDDDDDEGGVGPQGPRGPVGPEGPAGPAGADGSDATSKMTWSPCWEEEKFEDSQKVIPRQLAKKEGSSIAIAPFNCTLKSILFHVSKDGDELKFNRRYRLRINRSANNSQQSDDNPVSYSSNGTESVTTTTANPVLLVRDMVENAYDDVTELAAMYSPPLNNSEDVVTLNLTRGQKIYCVITALDRTTNLTKSDTDANIFVKLIFQET